MEEERSDSQKEPRGTEIDSNLDLEDYEAKLAKLTERPISDEETYSHAAAFLENQKETESKDEWEAMTIPRAMSSSKESSLPRNMEETEEWLNKQDLKVLKRKRVELELARTQKQLEDIRTRSTNVKKGRNSSASDDSGEGFEAMKLLTNADPDVRKYVVRMMNTREYQEIVPKPTPANQIRAVILHAKLALKKPITDEDKAAFGTSNGSRELLAFLQNYPSE
jgi:hypothetical protein